MIHDQLTNSYFKMGKSAPADRIWNKVFTITLLRKGLAILITTTCIVVILLGIWISFAPMQESIPNIPINFKGPRRPAVILRQGTYTGINNPTKYPQPIDEFRGIPYGLSTAGERRFAAPLPVNTTSAEVIDASEYGYRCPFGPNDTPGDKTQDEDCLNVNIYRPQRRPLNKKLPVLIHFYGGSFNFGAGNSRQINNLVGYAAEPFIGVSFNHRIGALGFLSSGLGKKEGLLNAGLKDQVLLLEWIRDNIAEFGGDPNDVTLMGNSAGAHGVSQFFPINIVVNTASRGFVPHTCFGGLTRTDTLSYRWAIMYYVIPRKILSSTKQLSNQAVPPQEPVTHHPTPCTSSSSKNSLLC